MDKKEIIRLAAIKVIAKEGFYNTKMSSIAEEAGIAIGTLYLYFKSKEDILDYIFQVEYEKKIRYMESLEKSDMPFLQQLNSFLIYHLNIFKQNPDTAKVIMQECNSPSLQDLKWVKKTNTDIPNLFKALLDKAKQNGETKIDFDSEIIGLTMFLATRYLAYKLQKDGREKDYDYAYEQIASIINLMK